jgi:transcriptional regulator with XRE-family HTH domain
LRERLALLGITQSQIADLCEVHPNTVYNWAAGRTRMNAAADLLLELLEDRPVSNDTLLRLVRRRGRPRFVPPTVIGIDDWAWRRNQRYGTIICDAGTEIDCDAG